MAKSLKQLFSCIALFPHFQMNLSIYHSSLDRDPRHGFEGDRYILLRITDV